MKRLFLLSLFYLLFCSTSLYAGEPTTVSADITAQQNTAIIQRVKNANKQFSDLVAQNPFQSVDTIVHFRNSTTLDQIASITSRYNLNITAFRFSDGQGSGGYKLKPNETVAQAIVQFKRDHELFMQRDYNLTKKYLSEATSIDDPQIVTALNNRISDVQLMQLQFKTRGLQIIGVELNGTASANDKFRKENNFVRVVEILSTSGIPQPSIFNQ